MFGLFLMTGDIMLPWGAHVLHFFHTDYNQCGVASVSVVWASSIGPSLGCIRAVMFFYRASYASAVLAVVILFLSVRPSVYVTCMLCDKTRHCLYFDTTRKANHCSFVAPTVVGGVCL